MVFWHLDNDLTKNCTFTSLEDLYLYDYKNYYTLQHDCKNHLKCLEHPLFKKYFISKIDEYFYKYIQTRFYTGKIDIFIPFDKNINPNLKTLIEQQTIYKDCNFYFISITENKQIEKQVYELFYNVHKNNLFLKAKSLSNAFYVFLNNSYRNKKYCLDLNNYNCLNDSRFLEKLLN